MHDFSSESLMIEINDPKNLIVLCPTHHWEFDHGYLATKNQTPPSSTSGSAGTSSLGSVIG